MVRISLAALSLAFVLPSVGSAAEYTIDKAHSAAIFKAHHMRAGYTYGMFLDVEGVINADPANAAANSVNVTIKTDSVTTHDDKRDKHLKGPDFFNTKQFPTMTFKSTSVTKVDDTTMTLNGDLTIRGVTKPVTAKAIRTGIGKNPQTGAEIIGYETTFTIKRSDFGMSYMVGDIGDEVTLIIGLEAGKK